MKVRVRVGDCDGDRTVHEGEYEGVHTTREGRSHGVAIRWLAQLSDNKVVVSAEGVGALIKEHDGTLWICSGPSDLSYMTAGDISVIWTKEQEEQVVQEEQEVSDGAR